MDRYSDADLQQAANDAILAMDGNLRRPLRG